MKEGERHEQGPPDNRQTGLRRGAGAERRKIYFARW
jgi:hypothetical protein